MIIADTTADAFVASWNGYLACDVGPKLTCDETEALAELITEMQRPDLAATWIEYHAHGDEPGDLHYRGSN